MNKVLGFYPADRMVEVEAGIVTKALQDYADSQGFTTQWTLRQPVQTNWAAILAPMPAVSRSSNTAWPATGFWVLTVVTGKGDILHLNKGMIKMPRVMTCVILFIGAEGTLGIVTEVQVKLERQPKT